MFASVLFSLILLVSTGEAAQSAMEKAFWARSWQGMDAAYQEHVKRTASGDAALPSGQAGTLSPRDLSLYVNGLWRQGRYPEGVAILQSIQQDMPQTLQPYAKMLFVLGLERTDRKQEAHEAGGALWNDAPEPIRYYLAYAMGRLARDLSRPEEALQWFREMLQRAPDKKRRLQALNQMINLPGVTADEAAALLVDAPANAKALAICRDLPRGKNSTAEYALGYNAYINQKYATARTHFELASADKTYGEAANYYHAYAAYREKKDDTAYELWSAVARTGYDYPQRSVQRLTTLSNRARRQDILDVFGKVAEEREKDYPELAADALVGIIRLGSGKAVTEAEKKLFTTHAGSNQAATVKWERGWDAWKAKNYKGAYDQWSGGYSNKIPNAELASRLLYWQSRALEKLESPVAAKRVKEQLVNDYPAEYHTFLVSPDGGIARTDIPESYISDSELEDWGFVTYARLEAAEQALQAKSRDIPVVYRASRLALWEGDYASAVRAAAVVHRLIPAKERASAEFLKNMYPRAFETEVQAAVRKTGLDAAVIWGIMRQESMYEPDVISVAGAYGLMQLMPATAKSEAGKMKMDENAYRQVPGNVMLGANHMVGLIARFKELPLALAAYNAGGSPVTRWSKEPITDMAEWVENIGYRETRGYVKAVLRNIQVYRLLYDRKAAQ